MISDFIPTKKKNSKKIENKWDANNNRMNTQEYIPEV